MCVNVGSEGKYEVWVGEGVDDVELGLVLCFELVEDGSRYLYVVVLFMYNVDNGK